MSTKSSAAFYYLYILDTVRGNYECSFYDFPLCSYSVLYSMLQSSAILGVLKSN